MTLGIGILVASSCFFGIVIVAMYNFHLIVGSFCRGSQCLTQRENEMSELGMNRLMCIYNMNSSKNEKNPSIYDRFLS